MKEIEIKSRYDGKVLVCGKYESIKDCLEKNRDADLTGAYLRGADLRGADLTGAYLRDADLRGADLRGADLTGAYLRDADLTGAYLRGADLTGAYLRDADLTGAYLRDADLRGAYLRGADLTGADLRGAKNYSDNHDFCVEIIKRQKIEVFTEKEWAIIAQIYIHKLCWESIEKKYGKKVLPIFKKIADFGFPEYLEKCKEEFKK